MNGIRLEVARTAAALGTSARRWGRRLVVDAMSPGPAGQRTRAGLLLVAGPVRAIGTARTRWSSADLRAALAFASDRLLALVPNGPAHALVLAELRVSRELDVGLRLRGAPERLDRVSGLALVDATGTTDVETVRDRLGDTLWLSAALPADRFADPAARCRLQVRDPDGTVRVRAGRRRLRHRWSRRLYAVEQWPVRVRLDWRRDLVVTGLRPNAPDLPYGVLTTPNALDLTWTDQTTTASVARFTHRGTGQVVLAEGWTEPQAEHRVRLDFDQLVDSTQDWDLEVLTTGHGPVPLRSRPGIFPSLRGVVRFPEAYATTRTGPAWGSLRFGAGNRLVARVRPAGADRSAGVGR